MGCWIFLHVEYMTLQKEINNLEVHFFNSFIRGQTLSIDINV